MIIFVGDTPSPKMEPGAKAFQGADCESRLYDWINQIVLPGNYAVINSTDLVLGVWKQVYKMNQTITFIALGNNASKRLKDVPHFKLPHPSGKNRQINNKAFIDNKLKECKKYIESY